MNNPFVTRKPVSAEYFVGRKDVVRRIFAALISNSHNVVLVDQPKSGKTSLLTYAGSHKARSEHLGSRVAEFLFVSLDCGKLLARYREADFWRAVTDQIAEPLLKDAITVLLSGSMEMPDVQRFLDALKQARRKLVLMIDELELMLPHPHLGTGEFLAGFRSLSEDGSLSIIAASQLNVEQLNARTEHEYGSPKFNYFQNERLGAFSDIEVDGFLTHYLGDDDLVFSAADRVWIKRVAGGFPYLAQAAAWIWFDLVPQNKSLREKRRAAGSWLRGETAEFCRNIYQSLNHRERQLLSQIAVSEQPTRMNPEQALALTELIDQALIDRAAGKWRVRSECLAEWIVRHAAGVWRAPAEQAVTTLQTPPLRLFISAAEQDVEFCIELDSHMASQNLGISCWHRGKIPPGADQLEWLLQEARTADIILVLLSAEHLCYSQSEVAITLARAAASHVELIPILAHALAIESTPFVDMRLLPETQQPVRKLRHRAHAWAEVTKHVAMCTRNLRQRSGVRAAHDLRNSTELPA